MIKSTTELNYDARNGEKQGIIQVEINNWLVNQSGVTYTVNDHAVNGSVKTLINSVDRFRTWEELNLLNEHLKNTYDYSGLTKKEIEFLKVKHGLLFETKTKPIYGSIPENWVLTENVVE